MNDHHLSKTNRKGRGVKGGQHRGEEDVSTEETFKEVLKISDTVNTKTTF